MQFTLFSPFPLPAPSISVALAPIFAPQKAKNASNGRKNLYGAGFADSESLGFSINERSNMVDKWPSCTTLRQNTRNGLGDRLLVDWADKYKSFVRPISSQNRRDRLKLLWRNVVPRGFSFSPWLFFAHFFFGQFRLSLAPLSAPGSPRM